MGKKCFKPPFSHSRLLDLLHYDPSTGIFIWVLPQGHRAKKGELAGHLSSAGYRVIGIDGRVYPASSLAVFYVTGVYPLNLVDHINRHRSDDAYSNLRVAGYQQNSFNTGAHADNASGFKGVHRHHDGRWRAQISVSGKRIHIGVYNTAEAAHVAYLGRARVLHGEFFYGGENR